MHRATCARRSFCGAAEVSPCAGTGVGGEGTRCLLGTVSEPRTGSVVQTRETQTCPGAQAGLPLKQPRPPLGAEGAGTTGGPRASPHSCARRLLRKRGTVSVLCRPGGLPSRGKPPLGGGPARSRPVPAPPQASAALARPVRAPEAERGTRGARFCCLTHTLITRTVGTGSGLPPPPPSSTGPPSNPRLHPLWHEADLGEGGVGSPSNGNA